MALPFIEKLRMGNIYNPPRNIGYPDIRPQNTGGISFSPDTDFSGRRDQQMMAEMIAKQRQEQKPMDVVYQPPVSESGAFRIAQQTGGVKLAQLGAQLGLKEKELDFKQLKHGDDLNFKQAKHTDDLAIKQQRADVYDFKAKNPNAKFITSKGGNIMAINPMSGELLGEWDSGTMSDEEKLNLQSENAGKLEDKRQTGRTSVQTQRDLGAMGRVVEGGNQTRLTNAEKPVSSGTMELEKKRALENRATQALINNPEWDDYIEFTDDGVKFNPPSDPDLERLIRSALLPQRGDVKLTAPGESVRSPSAKPNAGPSSTTVTPKPTTVTAKPPVVAPKASATAPVAEEELEAVRDPVTGRLTLKPKKK